MNKIAFLYVTAVVLNEDKVLLIKDCNGKLNLPTGPIIKGETPYRAIVRVLDQKTGFIKLDPSLLDGYPNTFQVGTTYLESHEGDYSTTVYRCSLYNMNENFHSNIEDVDEYVWMDITDVYELESEHLKNRLIKPTVTMATRSFTPGKVEHYVSLDLKGNIVKGR